jgi:hypothetical protein
LYYTLAQMERTEEMAAVKEALNECTKTWLKPEKNTTDEVRAQIKNLESVDSSSKIEI